MIGIGLTEVASQLNTIVAALQLGLNVAALTVAYDQFVQRLGGDRLPMIGSENTANRLLDRLLDPVLAEAGPRVHKVDSSGALLRVIVAAVLLAAAIGLELIGLVATTGAVLAGYHYLGISLELASVYRWVIAFIILFAIAVMSRANERINIAERHA